MDEPLIALAVAGLALLVALVAHVRLFRMKRAYAVSQRRRGSGGPQADPGDAIRHVAVVRYDAFPDMGGRLSFSAALLDDAADGLVLTSINGRSETRTYAKGVRGGRSEQALSPEEQQAITQARGRGR